MKKNTFFSWQGAFPVCCVYVCVFIVQQHCRGMNVEIAYVFCINEGSN